MNHNFFTAAMQPEPNARPADQLRNVEITRHYLPSSPGSVLYRSGNTVVLCTASIQDSVPPWMTGKGRGWVTAEYNMLPHSTSPRKQRERSGKVDGRTTEIQRLIGRSMRSIVDLDRLGERSITVDCDVLQADGGTRTASITGGFIALADAIASAFPDATIGNGPLKDSVAAISVVWWTTTFIWIWTIAWTLPLSRYERRHDRQRTFCGGTRHRRRGDVRRTSS